MGHFTFEGDAHCMSEKQCSFLSEVLESRGFKNGKIEISDVGSVGDNYVANVKRLRVVENNGKTLSIVAKIAPRSEQMRNMMQTQQMFSNEHIMYTEVLKKFSELEEKAGIPKGERLRHAECYGSIIDEPDEFVLLEDLKLSNFCIMNKYISLTSDCVKLILENFAKLHSLSYALKSQEPEEYELLSNKLVNTWVKMHEKPNIDVYFQTLEDDVISILDSDRDKAVVRGSLVNMPANILKNVETMKNSKYGVIHQGDSWTNNIMFMLEEAKPVECCMIDYQISSHNSPAADLLYMIFNCTDYEVRSKNYHEWLDYYHDQLDKCLSRFGLKACDVFPRTQLDADLKRLGKTFLAVSIMLASVLLRETHEQSKLKEAMGNELSFDEIMEISKFSNMDKTSIARFQARLNGIVASSIDLEYI